MTGYQQAILMLLGVDTCGKFLVRCVDRWYIDAVSELFPSAPYLQRRADGKKDFWVLKSARVHLLQSLADVTDWQGFCRGVVELQACLDLWPHKVRGKPTRTPRLRVYGQPELLTQVSSHFPAGPKKLQFRRTQTGETCVLYYQSPAEVADILNSLHGEPCNHELWARWDALMQQNKPAG